MGSRCCSNEEYPRCGQRKSDELCGEWKQGKEAVKRVEGPSCSESSMVAEGPSPQAAEFASHRQDPETLHVKKKVDFVAKVEKKSRKIDVIVSTAERFLELQDFSAEELHGELSQAVPPSGPRT